MNLRGEYHTENVTTFDAQPKTQAESDEVMDIDIQEDETLVSNAKSTEQEPTTAQTPLESTNEATPQRGNASGIQPELELDTLYAAFWSLQESFSKPTRLFDTAHFASLKSGLEATLSSFRKVSSKLEVRSTTKGSDELRRGTKRKRGEGGADLPNSFNPKYLTSRDLFELEV